MPARPHKPTTFGTQRQTPAEFSAAQDRVAALLAAGWSVRAAAAEAKVGERTVHTWRASKPGFGALVERIRADMYTQSLGRLAALTTLAVDSLEEVLRDKETPHAARVSAARGVLADAMSMRTSVETAAQIAELERRLPRAKQR